MNGGKRRGDPESRERVFPTVSVCVAMCLPGLSTAVQTVDDGRMPTQTSPRQIRFNAFDMNCVAHQSSGMWRHPDDQAWRYKDLNYWTELAKLLERGTFDGIFIADVLGTYDVYGGNDIAALRQGAQSGFNLAYAITPGSFEDIVRHVVPVLSERGAYATEYTPGTLRNALFDKGDRLAQEHRGARYRLGGSLSTALPDDVSRPGTVSVT